MDKAEIMKEIFDYIKENRITSYYELKFYAHGSQSSWLPLFQKRTSSIVISEYIKGIRKEEQEKGNKTLSLYESLEKILKE